MGNRRHGIMTLSPGLSVNTLSCLRAVALWLFEYAALPYRLWLRLIAGAQARLLLLISILPAMTVIAKVTCIGKGFYIIIGFDGRLKD